MAINDYLRTSSINVEGNLNFRRLEDKARYNRWVLGQGSRAEMGHETVATNPTSRPPSWTQTDAKLDHAFVMLPVSASSYETVSLNVYRSGSEPLELTAVPASGSIFYSKREKRNYVQYKVSASALLGNGTFVAASGSLFTGSTAGFVGIIPIEVVEYGRLENIRVWVELAHQGSTETGSLDDLKICLRSPNVSNFFGIPWGNDPKIRYAYPKNMAAGGILGWGEFQNSYVLWYGRTLFSQEENDSSQICWGRDGNIRTVFWDDSPQKNPRNWGVLFASGTDSFNRYLVGYGSPAHTATGVAYHSGSGYSWMTDVRLSKGRWSGLAAGSPPNGWLTGPGGVAAENEFATTGSNLGPATIQPVYPLLDDIYEIAYVTGSDQKERKFSGFRPGLRGTEIHGTWELVFSNMEIDDDALYFRNFRLELWYSKNQRLGGHFGKIQQVAERKYGSVYGRAGKLTEIAVLSGGFNPWSDIVPTQDIYHRTHLTKVYIKNPVCYQRTVGITDSTSSFTDFAVFTRMTGALADRLTGSAHAHLRYLFLNNQFGTPFISIASGSGADVTGETFLDIDSNNRLISEIFRPLARVGSSYTLKTSLSGKGTTQKSRDIALEKVTGSI